jgi:hypothetical protein
MNLYFRAGCLGELGDHFRLIIPSYKSAKFSSSLRLSNDFIVTGLGYESLGLSLLVAFLE